MYTQYPVSANEFNIKFMINQLIHMFQLYQNQIKTIKTPINEYQHIYMKLIIQLHTSHLKFLQTIFPAYNQILTNEENYLCLSNYSDFQLEMKHLLQQIIDLKIYDDKDIVVQSYQELIDDTSNPTCCFIL
jgi:hypothetical protein